MAGRRDGEGIDDPEDISQKQRIKEILDRRRETLEARNMAKAEVKLGSLDELNAQSYYRTHLESLIYEIWNVLQNIEGDVGDEYLDERPEIVLPIDPPQELVERIDETDDGVQIPGPKYVRGSGLRWFIEAPDVVSREFRVQTYEPPGEVTAVGEAVVGWEQLDKGLRTALEFINVAGIDADLADQKKEAEGKYEWIEDKLEGDGEEDSDE